MTLARSTVRDALRRKGKASVSATPFEADPSDPRRVDIEDVLAEPPEPTPAEVVRANLAEDRGCHP